MCRTCASKAWAHCSTRSAPSYGTRRGRPDTSGQGTREGPVPPLRRARCAQARGASRISTPERRQTMGKVVLDMSVSLDGIGAGPNPNEQDRMGAGGERLHEWMPFYADGDPTAGL